MKILTSFLFILILSGCSKKSLEEKPSKNILEYDEAYAFMDSQLLDSAFLKFNQAKELFIDRGDSLDAGNCLINMASIQKELEDYFGAQETALEASDYLNKDDSTNHIYISTNFNILGAATYELGYLDRAIQFYESAIKYANDSSYIRVYQNNIAVAYSDKGNFGKADEIYKDVLSHEKIESKEYARTLTNYATNRWKMDTRYPAVKEFLTALHIRQQVGNSADLNSSYARLSDYYEFTKPDSSLYYARNQYFLATKTKKIKTQISSLGRLIRLNSADSAKFYFKTYKTLSDSLQRSRSAAKNQFALIRYEVEKNKADNLRLQKDNAEHASRLIRQRAATGSVVLVLLIVVSGGALYYKKRKQRLELESQNKIKESQLKTSRKVHDVVANGIYRVMTEIEYRQGIDREGILIRLDDMYRKSRDISYEAEEAAPPAQPYKQKLADLLKSFANENRRVLIVGNETDLWDGVQPVVKEELLQMLQEFMVNMKKHSKAENVVVRFESAQQQLHVHYKDDGVGMPKNSVHGNGLNSTGNRIKSLKGHITFASEPGKGLMITVSIPTA